MGMTALTNDKKRKEFLLNSLNWDEVPTANNFVLLRSMNYKGTIFFTLDLWQTVDKWDYQKKDLVEDTRWNKVGYYVLNEHTHALSYSRSVGDLVDRIKEIDKKEAK